MLSEKATAQAPIHDYWPVDRTQRAEFELSGATHLRPVPVEQSEPAGKFRAFGLDPSAIRGKSLLIVGSAEGDLCIAALERGAARVVGIDPSVEQMDIARHAAAGRPIEFVLSDFESWDDRGDGFDFVVCVNVLHKMLDPIHALRRMMRLVRETLVVEFSVPTLRHARKNKLNAAALLDGGAGLIAPVSARYNTDIYKAAYLFSDEAIRSVINRHSAVFEPAKITRTKLAGRHLAIANKRQIDHLTVIAGPTASGKGIFYKSVDSALRTELGIPQQDSAFVTASQISALPDGRQEHVVLHYDILRPFGTGLHNYERDIAVELLAIASRVTIITLFAASERLKDQLRESEINSRRPSKRSPRHLRLLQLYADPQFLPSWYERWLSYCQRFDGKSTGNFFVENCGTFEVRPASKENFASVPALARAVEAKGRG